VSSLETEDKISAVYPLETEKTDSKKKTSAPADDVYSIEMLQTIYKTPTPMYESLKIHFDWACEQEMTLKAYEESVEIWLNEPIGR
jgi:hypothetical protein